jgi:hypothetical protein
LFTLKIVDIKIKEQDEASYMKFVVKLFFECIEIVLGKLRHICHLDFWPLHKQLLRFLNQLNNYKLTMVSLDLILLQLKCEIMKKTKYHPHLLPFIIDREYLSSGQWFDARFKWLISRFQPNMEKANHRISDMFRPFLEFCD